MPKPLIAVTIGDPAGIGPEIALKALAGGEAHRLCRPLLVGDANLLTHYLEKFKLPLRLLPVTGPEEARFQPGTAEVLHLETVEMARFAPGEESAAHGKAILAYTRRALAAAQAGEVDAVVAGPHTQKSIAAAGIAFDGYPGFVAGETGSNPADVFLMLVSDERRIVHVTLHLGVRAALELITRERVERAVRATHHTLRALGLSKPRIAVSGVNPHAGEDGLFGREEIDLIRPALESARAQGVDVQGPYGADTMFLRKEFDAFLVMLHDQGHIPAKLAGFDNATAFTIGTPLLFATVAHGSAGDIAGQGRADPSGLLRALRRVSEGHP